MKTMRMLSLSTGLVLAGFTNVHAQLPKVGQPVQIKPGGDGAGKQPAIPGVDPVKNQIPNPKNGNQPGQPAAGGNGQGAVNGQLPGNFQQPNPGVGFQPGMTGGPLAKELDSGPKEIGNKTLQMWINELKTSKDAAVRENAVRVIPLFGPAGVIRASEQLLITMRTDSDLNVKLAAMSIAPLMIYDPSIDPVCNDRLDFVIRMLDSESLPVRYDATLAITGIGPVAKKAVPRLLARSTETSSWQVRKAAAAALGSVGRGIDNPANPAGRIDPVEAAVNGLLKQSTNDSSLAVRKEALTSLILIGPVAQVQQKVWRTTLDGILKSEKDRSILGLTRVAILKNDPAGVKGNDPLLTAIISQLLSPDVLARSEACQAIGMIGEPANKAAQDLLDVITNPKEDNSVVAAAIIAVSSMRSKTALIGPVLRKVAASHKSDDVKAYANEGIRVMEGVDPARPPLPKIAPGGAPGGVPEKK